MPDIYSTVQKTDSLNTRKLTAGKIAVYLQTFEVARQALRTRKEEMKVHRLIMSCSDTLELCKLVDAVTKLRYLMLEYCQHPKRPSGNGKAVISVPQITLESVPEPPQDTPTV